MNKANGSFNNYDQPIPPHPLDRVISERAHSGAIMEMKTGIFELGRNRALLSGATKPVPLDQEALEENARAMARETYRDSFDPRKHAHDKVREDEYQNQLTLRGEAQQASAHGRANLRDAENKLAKTAQAGEKPTANPWLMAASIVARGASYGCGSIRLFVSKRN